jgi:ribosomal protein S18 acetylase RimI-like enzyme
MKLLDVAVRRATPADAPLLAALHAHVQEPHVRAEPDLYRATDLDELSAWFAQRLAVPDVVIFVASADEPLGHVVTVPRRLPSNPFSPERAHLLVDEIGVIGTRRRLGVGRLLMQMAEQRAAELGLRNVQIDVRAFNAEAASFYEALGYAPVQLRLERRL